MSLGVYRKLSRIPQMAVEDGSYRILRPHRRHPRQFKNELKLPRAANVYRLNDEYEF